MSAKRPEPAEYENRLKDGTDLWIREGSEFFLRSGTVYSTLYALVQRFQQQKIPYAIIGALALGHHGFPRFTVDIDVLTTPDGLKTFRSAFEGTGYRPAFPGGTKSYRDTTTGVRIDFITSGEYPGDGRAKPVSFPDPDEVAVEQHGIRFVNAEKLVELKLASGISAEHRQRDLVDIQDLIREAKLPLEFAEKIDPSVRDMYRELWRKAQIPDPFQK
jgi:hypothetical protein